MTISITSPTSNTGAIQQNGSNVLTIDSSNNLSVTNGIYINGALASGNTMKNRIINGAMVIDQRNAGASVTASATGQWVYTLDRWSYTASQASKFTVQQNAGSVTPPAGFSSYLGVTSSSSYTSVSGDYFWIGQQIEGLNTADLAWGTANAKTVTLSFWVRSSLTGSFGGSIVNSAQNRSYPFSYTISSANTWTQISITIPGDTSGTWLTTNGIGMRVQINLGTGTTYSGPAGVWAGQEYESATGSVSVLGTSGATFYITGVQLEVGSTATAFEWRPYGMELALCQRYYTQSTSQVAASSLYNSAYSVYGVGWDYSSSNWIGPCVFLPVAMRATPTVTLYTSNASTNASSGYISLYQVASGWVNGPANINEHSNERSFTVQNNAGSTGSVGSCLIQFNYSASAEL